MLSKRKDFHDLKRISNPFKIPEPHKINLGSLGEDTEPGTYVIVEVLYGGDRDWTIAGIFSKNEDALLFIEEKLQYDKQVVAIPPPQRIPMHVILDMFLQGYMTKTMETIETFRKEVPLNEGVEACDQVDRLKEELLKYHKALDGREHGGIAGNKLVDAIQDILGIHWEGK